MAHVFCKTGHKESNPLSSKSLDELRKWLEVVDTCILKTEEKITALLDESARQQKVL
uniref:Uncharacterized protein n=1 Tax=Nelumbo nucifera TaxID=4432 RepID=A0A822YAR9_NELNU|nr:TPA_asm: hypothetical protein HUJ06_030682 [Nelumbo nucifera]